ncbi:origin recognition complex subunit 6-domain-containing protein [Peziza echinospora]|nr:origin recognition complex subunit 6-domain-containing protein [Peziza echinospora]
MNKSLEPLLSGLIPYLTGPVPDALINHATSLLAQSRSRISSLRPDEEPARAYLCAHIACERLKQRLDLPEILPRPPLPKRQYGVLYKQFNQMLPVGGPGGQASSQQDETVPAPAPTRRTKKPAVGKRNNPAMATAGTSTSSREEDLLLETIHYICSARGNRELLATNAVPHIISGARLTIPSSAVGKPPTTGEQIKDSQATIAALYILITSRLSGKEISGKEYTHTRSLLMEALNTWNSTHRADKSIPVGKVTTTDVDNALNGVMSSTEAVDWLRTLPVGIGINTALPEPIQQQEVPTDDEEYDQEVLVHKAAMADVDAAARAIRKKRTAEERQTGIGRMLQDRVDYTSARKRRMYAEWKQDVLKRVEVIERRAVASH